MVLSLQMQEISEPELLFGPGARAYIARKWNEVSG